MAETKLSTDLYAGIAPQRLVEQYPWFRAARLAVSRTTGTADAWAEIVAPWRMEVAEDGEAIDIEALEHLTHEDVIDRFLREEDLRIVAEEGEPDAEVTTNATLDEEDDLVSEDLAEIYLSQGLSEKAIEIYRKLSLLNPEKSVYFAELIGNIKKQ